MLFDCSLDVGVAVASGNAEPLFLKVFIEFRVVLLDLRSSGDGLLILLGKG